NDLFWFQSTEPLLEASYSVDAPASLPLVSEIYHPERAGKIEKSEVKAGDRIHYKWATHAAAQLVPEMAMDISNEVPMVVVSTDPSWQHFSKWWAELTKPQLEATPEIKAKV